MSWRLDLRPASFRGVGFEVRSHSARGGRRGAHHVYPLRDRGWVEDLGLQDDGLSFDAYVIGDDYMARRDALIEALKAPGAGDLIHPYLGRLRVVVDPAGGWTISESARAGRQATFSLNFLDADDLGSAPGGAADGPAATAEAASAMEAGAVDLFGLRIDLSGPEALIADAQARVDQAFSALDGARKIAARVRGIAAGGVGLVAGALGRAQGIAFEFLAVGDSARAVAALFTGLAEGIGGRSSARPVSLPGARPPARPPRRRRAPAEAAAIAAALRPILDAPAPPAALAPARIAANRAEIAAAFEAALIGELARATVEAPYASHGEAIAAMKGLDARIETAIRREASRPAASGGPDDSHLARLTDLRAVARAALIETAAALAPIARVETGESLPALALAWRIGGGIGGEADLLARNRIAHPLWSPAAVDVRGADV